MRRVVSIVSFHLLVVLLCLQFLSVNIIRICLIVVFNSFLVSLLSQFFLLFLASLGQFCGMLLIVEINLSLCPVGRLLMLLLKNNSLLLWVDIVLVFGGMLMEVALESSFVFCKFVGMRSKIGSPFRIIRVAAVIKLGQGLFGGESNGQKCDVVKHLISF